jgi:hypothetical protein
MRLKWIPNEKEIFLNLWFFSFLSLRPSINMGQLTVKCVYKTSLYFQFHILEFIITGSI